MLQIYNILWKKTIKLKLQPLYEGLLWYLHPVYNYKTKIGVNMNNLKKIGLTALAGSLVATSAYAGAMSVSGSAKVTYQGGKGDSAANPYSNSKGITFSGSGG